MKPNTNWQTKGGFPKALKKARGMRKYPTKAETKLFDALISEGIEFIFKGVFNLRGLFYFTDFILPLNDGSKLMVEIIPRGSSHKNEKYPLGYSVKGFSEMSVLDNIEGVISEICEYEVKPSKDLISVTRRMNAKLIPEGLKGDGTYAEEEYGYTMSIKKKGGKYRGGKIARLTRRG